MPFVELDTGILNSTIWFDREAREVFITALLLSEPYVTDKPLLGIEVGSLNPNGFTVPPGWYGFVSAAGPGIVHRAGVDPVDGMEALKRLCAPEQESRGKEFEGRRLQRVDGGYIVLNYMKYRERDYTNAERQKRWRQRNAVTKQESNAVTPLHNTSNGVIVTQAEAYTSNTLPVGTSSKKVRSSHKKPFSAARRRVTALRHSQIQDLIFHISNELTGHDPSWGPGEGDQLSRALKENPKLSDEDWERAVRNCFASEDKPDTQRPRFWLPRITSYLIDPLDRFSRSKTNGKQSIQEVIRDSRTMPDFGPDDLPDDDPMDH
jgi:hypothetical protein